MHIGIAADRGRSELKGHLGKVLEAAGHQVEDYRAYEFVGDNDYPDFVVPMAGAVARGEEVRGVAICGSGVSACMKRLFLMLTGLKSDFDTLSSVEAPASGRFAEIVRLSQGVLSTLLHSNTSKCIL